MKSRIINTKFWDDNYTSDLDPIEKLMFLYLLTNTSTNISGVYEIPLKKIATETGIDKEMVQKILDRFDRDGKVFYIDGWVWIKNFIKNQNERSPKVKKGIELALEAVPSQIKVKVEEKLKGIDTLSHSNSNSNSNLNSNSNTSEPKVSQDIVKFIDLFQTINPSYRKFFANKTQRAACERLLKIATLEKWVPLFPALERMNADKYARGKSITPLQLEDNLGYFKAWIEQKKEPDPKRKVAIIPEN